MKEVKVRGFMVSKFYIAGSEYAIVRLADREEGELITPGSDQADAVLRLEGIAKMLNCSVNRIESNISTLLSIEKHMDNTLFQDEDEEFLENLNEILAVAEDLGFEPVIVVGDVSEFLGGEE